MALLGDITAYAKKRIPAGSMGPAGYVGVETLLSNRQGRGAVSHACSERSVIEFLPNDILVGNIRPYLRKIWLADEAGGTNGDVLVIRIQDGWRDAVLPRYLYHCLATDAFFRHMELHSRGSKMPRGDKDATMRYPLELPSVDAQADVVELLDALGERTERLAGLLRREADLEVAKYELIRGLMTRGREPSG